MRDLTPEALRESAAAHDRAAADSFDRCDTDGFATQAAHGLCAERDRLAAKIAENNGYHAFPALFDRTGALVHGAREVETRYGWAWMITGADGAVSWFNPSRAKDWRKRLKADAAKGYFVGSVLLPATSVLRGSGTGMGAMASVWAVAVPLNGSGDYRDYVIRDNGSASVPSGVIMHDYEMSMSRYEWDRIPQNDRDAHVINVQLYRATLWG